MGADAVIVNAAYAAAMANVPHDLGDVYKAEVETQKTILEGIKTTFDALTEDTLKLNDDLKEVTQLAINQMDDGTDEGEEMMSLYKNEIDAYKEELKNIPLGPAGEEQRMKLQGKIDRLKNSMDKTDETLYKVGQFVINDQHNPLATGTKNMSLFKAIADKTADVRIENGRRIYSTPGKNKIELDGLLAIENPGEAEKARIEELKVAGAENDVIEMDYHDLEKAMVTKDYAVQNTFETYGNDVFTDGKTKGMVYNADYATGIRNNIENKMFKTRESFAHIITTPVDNMSYTFQEAVNGKDSEMGAEMYGALDKLGDRFDFDNSGTVDAKDFKTEANMQKLITALTDIHHEDFDFQAAKKAASAFYEKNYYAKKFGSGKGMRINENVVPGGKKGKPYQQAGWGAYQFNTGGSSTSKPSSITWVDAERRRTALNNFEIVSGEHGNYTWDGKMYVDQDDNKYTVADVARIEGLIKPGEKIADFRVEKIESRTEETAAKGEGKAYVSLIKNTTNDDDAAITLNKHFGLQDLNEDLAFAPFAEGLFKLPGDKYGTTWRSADSPDTDDIMLYYPGTDEP